MFALPSEVSHPLFAAALLGGFLAAVAGEPARAVDDKIFPGSFCKRFAGPSLGIEPLNESSLENRSTESMGVDCPIIKENITTGVLNAFVQVIDRHPSLAVTCRLCNVQRFPSSQVTCSTPRSSEGNSQTPQFLFFSAQAGFGSSRQNWLFSCSIPPQASGAFPSAIYNYMVNEQ